MPSFLVSDFNKITAFALLSRQFHRTHVFSEQSGGFFLYSLPFIEGTWSYSICVKAPFLDETKVTVQLDVAGSYVTLGHIDGMHKIDELYFLLSGRRMARKNIRKTVCNCNNCKLLIKEYGSIDAFKAICAKSKEA